MARKIPDFDKMKNLYPGKGYSVDAVKQLVGGDINAQDVKNTCVVRLSVSLNKIGELLPPRNEKFKTRRGKDKHWYGLRVTEFWDYLVKTYGRPTITMKAPLSRDQFSGSRGIIGFRVGHDHFNDATGHFTLWNGSDLLYGGEDHDYWNIASEAALWESGDGIHELSAPV